MKKDRVSASPTFRIPLSPTKKASDAKTEDVDYREKEHRKAMGRCLHSGCLSPSRLDHSKTSC